MTALRLISLPLHGAIELLIGLVALVVPFALGFGPAAAIVTVAVGVCAIGLALDATEPSAVATHQGYDYGLACGALLAAVPLAATGAVRAALVLGALGLAQLALNGATRYSARG
jgi:hypothetical protein